MQQYDVVRQFGRAVEEFADRGQSLKIGKVPTAARNATLNISGTTALGLHLRVVIALKRDAVELMKALEKVRRDTAEVRCATDAIAKPLDHEAMGAKLVMSKLDWIAHDTADGRERSGLE